MNTACVYMVCWFRLDKMEKTEQYRAPRKARNKKKWVFASLVLLILGAGVADGWLYLHRGTDPVPKSIRQSVSFPIYYPDPKKLPVGYNLNLHSLSASAKAVIYSINYDDGKKLVFTIQKRPTDSELGYFDTKDIPINHKVLTLIGTATVGAIGQQTIVSLPTDGGSWILMTGPAVIDQSSLNAVLRSLTKAV